MHILFLLIRKLKLGVWCIASLLTLCSLLLRSQGALSLVIDLEAEISCENGPLMGHKHFCQKPNKSDYSPGPWVVLVPPGSQSKHPTLGFCGIVLASYPIYSWSTCRRSGSSPVINLLLISWDFITELSMSPASALKGLSEYIHYVFSSPSLLPSVPSLCILFLTPRTACPTLMLSCLRALTFSTCSHSSSSSL